MYKPETIKRAMDLLNMMDAKDDPVIEVRFNDTEKKIEIWNVLADNEKIIAKADYPKEQEEASSEDILEKEGLFSYQTSIGGSLIPVLLKAVTDLIAVGVDILDLEFTFDAKRERLYAESDKDDTRSWPY